MTAFRSNRTPRRSIALCSVSFAAMILCLIAATRTAWAQDVTITDLGTLGGNLSEALAINASGQVVGWSYEPLNQGYHAFLYSGGVVTDLGVLAGQGDSVAYAINASGQVVGVSNGGSNGGAFLYSGGVMSPFMIADVGGAFGINDSGQIVGQENLGNPPNVLVLAFLYSGGVLTNLGVLPGGGDSVAYAINASGQVVGYSSTAGLAAILFT